MEVLSGAGGMVAIGQCGLDSSDSPNSQELKQQSATFEAQLKIAKKKNLPVVIHCRGEQRIQILCLDILSNNLPSDYHIYWHCFNTNTDDYRRKKTAFPNSKFGISPFLLMEDKNPDFRSLVCSMELTDLLLETDSPYLSPSKSIAASPLLLREMLWKMASMFNSSQEKIAEVTTQNLRKLYRIE